MNIILDFTQSSDFQRADLRKRLQTHFPRQLQATKSTNVAIIKFTLENLISEITTIKDLQKKQPSIGEDKIALLEEYKTALLYLVYEKLQENNKHITLKLNTLSEQKESQNPAFEFMTAAGITCFNFLGYFFSAVVFLYNWLPWIAGLFCMHLAMAPVAIIIGAAAMALLGIHFFIPAIKNFFNIDLFPSREESYEKQFLIVEKINNLLLAENSNINAQAYLYLMVIVNPINKHIRALKEKPLENKRPISAMIKSAFMVTVNCIISSGSAYNLLSHLRVDIAASALLGLGTIAHLPLFLCMIALPSFFMITFNVVRFLSNATIFNAEDRTNQDYLLLKKRVHECTVVPKHEEFSNIYHKKYEMKSAQPKKSFASKAKYSFQSQNQNQQANYSSGSSNNEFPFFKKRRPPRRHTVSSDSTTKLNRIVKQTVEPRSFTR